jgi:hypothetical protein
MAYEPRAESARSISIARSGASQQGISRPAMSSTSPAWVR